MRTHIFDLAGVLLIGLAGCSSGVKYSAVGIVVTPPPTVTTSQATLVECPYGGVDVTVSMQDKSTTTPICNGTPGIQGVPGLQGTTGLQGDVGPQGSQGLPGDTGSEGPQGSTGVVGPTGAQGPAGTTGQAGVIGPQGPQGVPGINGTDGTQIQMVQFCPGVIPTYPSSFPEYGICIAGTLFGVYSANGGFLAELAPGEYSSDGINASCTFTIGDDCAINY